MFLKLFLSHMFNTWTTELFSIYCDLWCACGMDMEMVLEEDREQIGECAQSSILEAAIASVKAFLSRKLVRTSLSLKPCCNPNSCSDVFCTTCFTLWLQSWCKLCVPIIAPSSFLVKVGLSDCCNLWKKKSRAESVSSCSGEHDRWWKRVFNSKLSKLLFLMFLSYPERSSVILERLHPSSV
jgi:hypothetical protein